MNCETHALLEYWNFRSKNVDEACDFFDWLAWNTYEFETSSSHFYIPPPCIPKYAPFVCEICHHSNHDSNSCPYYIYVDGFARLTSIIETMNE